MMHMLVLALHDDATKPEVDPVAKSSGESFRNGILDWTSPDGLLYIVEKQSATSSTCKCCRWGGGGNGHEQAQPALDYEGLEPKKRGYLLRWRASCPTASLKLRA